MNTTATGASAPTIFQFHQSAVRIITDEAGELWFVAKDICDVLELDQITEALRGLDPDELSAEKLQSGGQLREMRLISESGLYTLIIRSNKPQAKPFRRWVTREVLPALRRDGYYEVATEPEAISTLTTGPSPVTVGRLEEAARGVKAAMIMARALGYTNEQARTLANGLVREITGLDAIELMGNPDRSDRRLPLLADQPAPTGAMSEQTLADFLDELCIRDPAAFVPITPLFHAYCTWLQERFGVEFQHPSSQRFHREMGKHFHLFDAHTATGQVKSYSGLRLAGAECPATMADLVGQFVAECCLTGGDSRANATELYQAYSRWYENATGKPAPGMKMFGGCMVRMFSRTKVEGRIYYQGLSLKEVQA